MGMDTPVFVAETDELGDVICVWRTDETGRPARPIRRREIYLPQVETAQFFGAPSTAIIQWLRGQSAK